MDIGSIILVFGLTGLVFLYIFRPIRARMPALVSKEEMALSPLLAERERIIDALVELDFDNELGKVPEDIYEIHRTRLLDQGAEVLRQLDELQPGVRVAGVDQLEEKIAGRRSAASQTDDPLEAKIAARRAAQKPAGKEKFCHECGDKIKAGDQFCANCGAVVS